MDRLPEAVPTAAPDGDLSVLAAAGPGSDRRRILLVDGLIALAVAMTNLPVLFLYLGPLDMDGQIVLTFDRTVGSILAYLILLVAPLTFRRLWPRASHLAICAIYLFPLLPSVGGIEIELAEPTVVLISLFSLAVTIRQWRELAFLSAITVIVLLIPDFRIVFDGLWPEPSSLVFSVPYVAIPLILALVLARALRGERDRAEQSQREAVRVALVSEARAEEAAAAERRRLAAELHDIVAHHVNLMVVQAESGPYLPDHSTANTTFATIATTGRTALGELDRLLGILRKQGDEPSGTAPIAPLPTLNDIPALVTTATQAGIPLHLEHFDIPPRLDAATAATAHRIVQECITNVIKHADRTETATIAIGHDAATLQIDIRNRTQATPTNRNGYGLISMRSRAEALNGTLTLTESDGWFHVAAILPLAHSPGHPLAQPIGQAGTTPAPDPSALETLS